MKRPWEVIDQEIFPYLTGERLFADLRALRSYGQLWHASCPIHKDHSGAFSIDPQRLEWSCSLGCGGGGPIQYLQKARGLSWMGAARELAHLAGVDPAVLDPWQGHWTEEDFILHERLERRSSLLGLFMTYTQSFFRSQAGTTVRGYLVNRQGFPEDKLAELDLGLYTAPEDVWHCLKKTGRDLEEVRSWGLFEPKWSGRVIGCWRDVQGRCVNIWGWQPKETSSGQARLEGCTLFEQGDALTGKSVPFNLDAAARLDKTDLLLLEGPIKVLLTQSLGLEDPFPVAAGGDLNSQQIEAIQEHLRFGGKLTLCWDYDPATQGSKKDRAVTTLKRLKKANFPIYVVDPTLMADPGRPKEEVTVNDFIRRQGGGEKGLRVLQELLERQEKYEAQVIIQEADSENQSWDWPGVFDVFHNLSSRNRAEGGGDEIVFDNLPVLEPFFRAAEELGRRVAKGFLRGLPKGLANGFSAETLTTLQLTSYSNGEVSGLPAPISVPPSFSVGRLEQETRVAPLVQPSGWQAVDSLEVRFNPGELAVLGGRTGHGKTSMLLGLLLQWLDQASEEGTDRLFLFYSVEEPEVRIYHRLLSLLTARDGEGWTMHQVEDYLKEKEKRPGEYGLLDPETLEAAEKRLCGWERCLQILYQPTWTISELEAYARNLAEDRTMGAILVDHLQRIPPPRGTRGRRDVEISTVAHRLKTLGVDLSCPIVTTAQISRQAVQRAGKIPPNKPLGDAHVLGSIKMRRPQLQHLREGGIEQEADLVLGLLNYAADYQAEVGEAVPVTSTTPFEVGTLKNRYGPVGSWASLEFKGRFGLLQDPNGVASEEELSS